MSYKKGKAECINAAFLIRGEWIEKIPADNECGFEWAIFTITSA